MTISFATGCWGNYWQQFGAEFVAAISAMDPRPAEVVIVTDTDISVPSWMRHLRPQSKTPMWDWFNEAVKACQSEWIACVGIDDLWLPDGIKDVTLTGDAVQFPGLENGKPWVPDQESYARLMEYNGNPMAGGTFFRRDVFLQYPWRRSVAADWLQWCELYKAGCQVSFDSKPRFNHRRHPSAHSAGHWCPLSELHIRHLKHLLRTRDVIPGDEWPPITGQLMLLNSNLKIELGGGRDAFRDGWFNIDVVDEADIKHDLNVFPWPLADDSVTDVYSSHCIEHLDDPHMVQNEIARVCAIGARVELRTPHPNSHLAMTHGHKTVISPVQLVNTDTFFHEEFWRGPKRLLLRRIDLGPTLLLDVAKKKLPYVSRLSDYDIMQFVPGTCHESRFHFTVVKNDRALQNRHERAMRLVQGEEVTS